MENKYVILAGRLSGPRGPVCAQGLPRCLGQRPGQKLSRGCSVHSTGGRSILVSTRCRTWGCPGKGCADSAPCDTA